MATALCCLCDPAFATTRNADPWIQIHSQGEITGYQLETIRIHNKADRANTIESRSSSQVRHHINITRVDDDFSAIRFVGPHGYIPYRRINIEPGKYADFILKLDVPKKGVVMSIKVESALKKMTASTDEAVEEIFFDGWIRQGSAHTGELMKNWGVENTVIHEGIFRNWFRGSKYGTRKSANYAENGAVIRYAESRDGISWKESHVVTDAGPYEGQVHVAKDRRGVYHMMYNDGPVKDGINDYRYLTSTSGLPGTWQVRAENGFIIEAPPGNINFWQDAGSSLWRCLFEYHNGRVWEIGYAFGSDLDKLRKYPGNPVISGGGMVGGPDVHRLDGTYYMFGHAGEKSADLPTSLVRYKSKDLKKWSRIGWELRRIVERGAEAQIADPSIVEANGRTYLFYESQYDQVGNNLPSLSLAVWHSPLERLLDSRITRAIGDDLEAEGWKFTDQHGESNTENLGTVFRKISHMPSDISKTGVMIKAEKGKKIQVRKTLGNLAKENSYRFAVYPDKINGDFIFFGLLDEKGNEILKIWIDRLRGIHVAGEGKADFVSESKYVQRFYYFEVVETDSELTVSVDKNPLCSVAKISRTGGHARRIFMEQNSDSIGYISSLVVTKHSSHMPVLSVTD